MSAKALRRAEREHRCRCDGDDRVRGSVAAGAEDRGERPTAEITPSAMRWRPVVAKKAQQSGEQHGGGEQRPAARIDRGDEEDAERDEGEGDARHECQAQRPRQEEPRRDHHRREDRGVEKPDQDRGDGHVVTRQERRHEIEPGRILVFRCSRAWTRRARSPRPGSRCPDRTRPAPGGTRSTRNFRDLVGDLPRAVVVAGTAEVFARSVAAPDAGEVEVVHRVPPRPVRPGPTCSGMS